MQREEGREAVGGRKQKKREEKVEEWSGNNCKSNETSSKIEREP